MLYKKIQYNAHLLLSFKNKFLLNILVVVIITFIYNYSFYDISISDCMQRSVTSTTSEDISTHEDYIQFLEEQAWQLDQRITALERSRVELERENATLKSALKRLSGRLSTLEHKEELHLIKDKID